tara:strand:- start:678 stop:779 length:102 start_codon:yes stop_codon:yes gene_type:complete
MRLLLEVAVQVLVVVVPVALETLFQVQPLEVLR